MFQAGRKVLLFLDNVTVHNSVELIQIWAVKVVFFPKNTTCCTQPCDAGIIQIVSFSTGSSYTTSFSALSCMKVGKEVETLLPAVEEQMDIIPPVMGPEELFDRVVIEASLQAITPTEITKPEEDAAEIPNNKQVLQALETIEQYAAGRGDDEVLGGNFNLAWYKQVVGEANNRGRVFQEN